MSWSELNVWVIIPLPIRSTGGLMSKYVDYGVG